MSRSRGQRRVCRAQRVSQCVLMSRSRGQRRVCRAQRVSQCQRAARAVDGQRGPVRGVGASRGQDRRGQLAPPPPPDDVLSRLRHFRSGQGAWRG